VEHGKIEGDIGGEGGGEGYSVCVCLYLQRRAGTQTQLPSLSSKDEAAPANEGPTAREMTQHRVPPGWLEESDPAG
jgi:hypothetical protein